MALYTILFGISIFMIAFVMAIIKRMFFHWKEDTKTERMLMTTVDRPACSLIIYTDKCVLRRRMFSGDINVYDVIGKEDLTFNKELVSVITPLEEGFIDPATYKEFVQDNLKEVPFADPDKKNKEPPFVTDKTNEKNKDLFKEVEQKIKDIQQKIQEKVDAKSETWVESEEIETSSEDLRQDESTKEDVVKEQRKTSKSSKVKDSTDVEKTDLTTKKKLNNALTDNMTKEKKNKSNGFTQSEENKNTANSERKLKHPDNNKKKSAKQNIGEGNEKKPDSTKKVTEEKKGE